ncbi:IS701 family transposase [Polymorphospora sp. NPDC050346]|uniref:IS701 family transposase n=1 Tax=Polymorphospora sp. NPDC050346 TaxID=3155780 RepID=UPI00340C531E
MAGLMSGWELRLRELTGKVGHLFARPEPREVFHDLIEGLLSDLDRKNCWTLAQRAGHTQPGRMQALLSRGAWSADALEAEVRAYVVERLGDPNGVLIIDETQLPKKGDKSVGVAPQYCAATNRIENCQVAVMLSYAGRAGHAYIGRRLHLPTQWTDDPGRCREAGIPVGVGFATKHDQAVELLTEAADAAVPFGWVTMADGYGQHPRVRNWCAQRSLPYVVAVSAALPLTQISVAPGNVPVTRVDQLLTRIADSAWQPRTRVRGGEDDRSYDWALIRFDGNLRVGDEIPADGFTHTLLVRRSVGDPGEVTYFLAHARHRASAPVLRRIAETPQRIKEGDGRGKGLIGIDQHQVRTWTAWHHTVTACMFAHAFRAALHAEAATVLDITADAELTSPDGQAFNSRQARVTEPSPAHPRDHRRLA